MQIDAIDRKIIASLGEDARRSYADVGAQVALSAPAVKRRVDRLRAEGVITGFTAVIAPAALGGTTEAFVELFCAGRTSPAEIRRAALRHPEVVAAYTVSGDADAILHLRVSDISHLEEALEGLRAERFVNSTRSTIVLSMLMERPAALT
ncbi:Lrp/AsnC family transcriptional regulator [Fodinicola acaciae]|uniref:Lrp/AsnC family transcriptional regulator n=1 Tax=Fodinicola acaciae TaxID=2681555 RepID=UPI0013D568D2|nr:Lrp/AsnC family transcriptional regulator [Fodinicola acaciae]